MCVQNVNGKSGTRESVTRVRGRAAWTVALFNSLGGGLQCARGRPRTTLVSINGFLPPHTCMYSLTHVFFISYPQYVYVTTCSRNVFVGVYGFLSIKLLTYMHTYIYIHKKISLPLSFSYKLHTLNS